MKIFFFLLLPFFISSCLSKAYKDNKEQTQNKKVNNISIQARFIQDGYHENENTGITAEPGSSIDSSRELFAYFNIQLEYSDFKPDVKTAEYINFKMQDDFKLIDQMDTIMPVLVQRIINGRSNMYEYIVVFSNHFDHGKSGLVNILYDDKIFGIGKQIFRFERGELLKKGNG